MDTESHRVLSDVAMASGGCLPQGSCSWVTACGMSNWPNLENSSMMKFQERWNRGKAYMAKPVNGSRHPDRKEKPERHDILTV